MSRQADDRKKLLLRLDEATLQQLAEAAKRAVRSVNAEIVFRLRAHLSGDQTRRPRSDHQASPKQKNRRGDWVTHAGKVRISDQCNFYSMAAASASMPSG